MFWWVIWWHDGQSKRPLRQDKHGHYFLISHLLFVLQYFYHNFESCCWTIYTNRKIILHDVFVQLQSIFNSTNINHGQSYPIFGFWLKFIHQKIDRSVSKNVSNSPINIQYIPYLFTFFNPVFLNITTHYYTWVIPTPLQPPIELRIIYIWKAFGWVITIILKRSKRSWGRSPRKFWEIGVPRTQELSVRLSDGFL